MSRALALLTTLLLLGAASTADAYLALLRQGEETNSQATAEADDHYGATIVTGDFDADGYDDVAVASPWESNSLVNTAAHGVVHVHWGSPFGVKHTEVTELSPGSPIDNALKFGSAMTVGDFDGDGYDDLAVGVHADDQGTVVDAGSVWIYDGFADGIQLAPSLVIDQSTVGETNENYDNFGFTLAAGDFDANGYDDVAITAIGEDGDMGRVTVVYGVGAGGLSTTTAQTYDPTAFGSGSDPSGAWFGKGLATGDLDEDGYDDLVVGAPKTIVDGVASAGRVHVLYGSQVGLSTTDAWFFDRSVYGWFGDDAAELGWSVAVGHFRAPTYDTGLQIAAGAPGAETDGKNDTGAVYVITHDDPERGPGGLQTEILQPDLDARNSVDVNDRFGDGLAVGDHDGDGFDELAVSAPSDNVAEQVGLGVQSNAGSVYLIRGADTAYLLTMDDAIEQITHTTLNDHLYGGDNLGRGLAFGDVDGRGTDAILIGAPYGDRPSYDGSGTVSNAGRAYVHAPWRQPRNRPHRGSAALDCEGFLVYAQRAWQRTRPASTTKAMTLKVACDFMDQGQDPDEWIRVRPWVANNVGGSSAQHLPNDQLRFRDLLKTMMTVSGNDSAMLLGSFMTGENLDGSWLNWGDQSPGFAQWMEQQAADYGMSAATSFTNAAGIDWNDHYVTPLDFAIMSKLAIEDPCVKEVVERRSWIVTVRRPPSPNVQAPLSPINLLYTNGFVSGVMDLLPSTVGMKGGSTPGALRTGLYNSYVDLAGGHTAAAAFGVYGNGSPTGAVGDCLGCTGAELLELGELACNESAFPGSILAPEPTPGPWAFLGDVSTAEADTARGLVFDVANGEGNELGRRIQVDALRTNFAWPEAAFGTVLRHTSEVCIPSDGQEAFGIEPYQQHDGIAIRNVGTQSVDLLLAATDPVGYMQSVTIDPDSTFVIPATDGSGAGPEFTLTITNQTLRAEACLQVDELGYRQDVVLGDGVQTTDVQTWLLSRSLAAENETYTLEFHGGDALGGNTIDVSAHDPSSVVTAVENGDGPAAPRPGRSLLLPNVPNPFNPRTEIRFDLPRQGPVTVRVHDARGRSVRTLESGTHFGRGRHGIVWDGRDDTGRLAASGVYFVKLQTEGGSDARRIMLVK